MAKYNMDRLGWKAFQDLCTTIMQYLLGATYVPMSLGKDEGKDGFFQGTVKREAFHSISDVAGKVVFQCKHTISPDKSAKTALKGEVAKVSRLVKRGQLDSYVVFTNYRISGVAEPEIREMFENVGVKTCVVLGEAAIESIIDAHPFLRRLVPTLYGIGDLTQILDNRILEQSKTRLADLRDRAITFVSTSAYQRALDAIEDRGFVILLGPPGVGKSSVAANICLTGLAEGTYEDVLLLQYGPQFQTHWDPNANSHLYWYDDVFGSTSLDFAQVGGWQYQWPLLNTAIKSRRASVIFTCRDYIFNQAVSHIKRSDFPILFDSRVVINVAELTTAERQQILYNHIKFGSLAPKQKRLLKPFLPHIAEHREFTPEISRRLGDSVFFSKLDCTESGLDDFVTRAGYYFFDLVQTLDETHRAALVLILLHGNRLHSPVREDALQPSFKAAYGVALSEIKSGLEHLQGSLVKLDYFQGDAAWVMYHPSMLDALQRLLSRSPERIELFLLGGTTQTVLAGSTTVSDHEHKVFVPSSAWGSLIPTFRKAISEKSATMYSAVAGYLLTEATDDLLRYLFDRASDVLSESTIPRFTNLDHGLWYGLALRLRRLNLLDSSAEGQLLEHIEDNALWGDMHFLDNQQVAALLGEERRNRLVQRVLENSCEALREVLWNVDNEYMGSFIESLEVLVQYLHENDLLTTELKQQIEAIKADAFDRLPERPSDNVLKQNDRHGAMRLSGENIFSDVDE